MNPGFLLKFQCKVVGTLPDCCKPSFPRAWEDLQERRLPASMSQSCRVAEGGYQMLRCKCDPAFLSTGCFDASEYQFGTFKKTAMTG